MKPGTLIRLTDGREATVVYHGPDGYGVRFGRIDVDEDAILSGNPLFGKAPEDYQYIAQAMLREPSEWSAKLWPGMECLGEEYEVLS